MAIRKFKFNELRALHAKLGELIAESDGEGGDDAPAGPLGGAPKPSGMDSAHADADAKAHYDSMRAVAGPNADRIWKRSRGE